MVTEFDNIMRGRIRRVLIWYMKLHGVGVPALAERITAAHPRRPEIPVKTLQRFLDGRMRTHDMFVGFCAAFADKLPDPEPMGPLGSSLAATFEKLSGIEGVFVHGKTAPLPELGTSTMRLEDGGDFLRVTEVFEKHHVTYRGTMVRTKNEILGTKDCYVLAVLADEAFGLPRMHTLTYIHKERRFMGAGSGVDFLTGVCRPFQTNLEHRDE